MMRLTDGPAEGQSFRISRAPLFVRIVEGPGGWDILNMLDDRIQENERPYCYVWQDIPTVAHFRQKTGSGWRALGLYRLFEPQPRLEIMMDQDKWEAWVDETIRTSEDEALQGFVDYVKSKTRQYNESKQK